MHRPAPHSEVVYRRGLQHGTLAHFSMAQVNALSGGLRPLIISAGKLGRKATSWVVKV